MINEDKGMILLSKLLGKKHSDILSMLPRRVLAEISGYSASKGETDSTPNINAIGRKPQVGDVAVNGVPFGTQVRVEGLMPLLTVADRMNRRYGGKNLDIFFPNKKEALQYGRRKNVPAEYFFPNKGVR